MLNKQIYLDKLTSIFPEIYDIFLQTSQKRSYPADDLLLVKLKSGYIFNFKLMYMDFNNIIINGIIVKLLSSNDKHKIMLGLNMLINVK
jgi:hypothetical protein